MNDSLDAFELQLRRLKPVDPTPALRERIAAELSSNSIALPERAPAWRSLLDRWIGSSPSLTWKFAAAAVAIAVLCAAVFVSRLEVSPGSSVGKGSPVIHLNGSQPATTSVAAPEGEATSNYRLARAESESQALMDEGLVRDENGELARRVRMQFIDTLEWRD